MFSLENLIHPSLFLSPIALAACIHEKCVLATIGLAKDQILKHIAWHGEVGVINMCV